MTDATPENAKSEEAIPVPDYDQADWFLQSLINIVNGSGITFSITLNVGGQTITGQLVGGKQYFEGFADAFSGALPDKEEAEQVRADFASYGNIYANEDGTPKDLSPPHYIHLKNARCFPTAGNSIPANGGVWWRGRISQVDGFFLGELSPS
ncbi:gas vesicle accessory protein GvpU [Burkholderia cenocepacia]|uniref:gas vesicle accessory protein GvpU n=1 Tax=Burkholderia cenocepacia TaxID=95486 RepID=UPI001FC83693|nr:gas vesicle accessory protein GvpU [Burkholderia cenocepacia]